MRTFVGYPALTLRANPIQAVVTDLFAGFSWPTPILVELLFQPVIAQQPEMKRNCHYFRAVTLLHNPLLSSLRFRALLQRAQWGIRLSYLIERVCS